MTIEELQEQLLQQQEANAKLQAEHKALEEKNKKLLEDNARLTDYNNKLFMRITEPVEDKPAEKELTVEEKEAQQINDILKLMKDRENKFSHTQEKDIHERNPKYLEESYNAACSLVDKYNWYEVKCVKEDKIRTIEDIHEEIYQEIKKYI